MSLFKKDIIAFKQPFIDKYTLSIKSNIRAGGMPIKTEAIIRWEVKVKSIDENSIVFELLKLDDLLVDDGGNRIVKSVAEVSQLFSNMFKEVEVILNENYHIVKLLNPNIIKKKWEWTRKDISRLKDQEKILAHVINVNDEQFSNNQNMIEAIEQGEFFKFYFHQLYGHKENSISKVVKKKNYANTTYMDWSFGNTKLSENDHYTDYKLKGYLETTINKDWIKKAYKDFSHLKLDELKPVFEEEGKYRINKKTGQLIHASLTTKEIVHPELLFFEYMYVLESDTYNNNKESSSPIQSPISNNSQVEENRYNGNSKNSGFSLIVDE
jgi:hypothetical protein